MEDNPNDQRNEQFIKFDYIKSNFFRTIYADGVLASLTPRGTVYLSFWNERFPIPRQVVHKIEAESNSFRLGEEIDRVDREALVREIEIGCLLDIHAAKNLRSLLSEIIEELESQSTESSEDVEQNIE